MLEILLVNGKIIITLFLWIIAVYGFGYAFYRHLIYIEIICYKKKDQNLINSWNIPDEFKIIFIGLLGIISLTFLVSILNFFIKINGLVSKFFLTAGLLLFLLYYRNINKGFSKYKTYIFSAITSFFISAILSLFTEGQWDTGLYHIQTVKWIENFAVPFGVANIHGRLGFNCYVYNFAALTECSHIAGHTRSFLQNEIFIFIYFWGIIYSLWNSFFYRRKIYSYLLILSPLSILYILGLFRGLYLEGISTLIGLILIAYITYMIENIKQYEIKNYYFLLLFALYALLIKISNIMLIVTVFMVILFNIQSILRSKNIKFIIFSTVSFVLIMITWALKGIFTSGMIAYPASIGKLSFLPWTVKETQRLNEICWTKSFSRIQKYMDCAEILKNPSWFLKWVNSGVFFYIKHFLLAFIFLTFFLFILKSINKKFKLESNFIAVFIGLSLGITFWFFTAPDPRFGFAYFIPLILLLSATVCYQIELIFLKKIIKLNFIKKIKNMYLKIFILLSICITVTILFNYKILNKKNYYTDKYSLFTKIKIPKIAVIEMQTDYNLKIYIPASSGNHNSVFDAPLPSSPYFNASLAKEKFLGRDMYLIKNNYY